MRKNLIDARKKADLTQIEVAKLIGITDRHYKSLEAGTSKGSIDVWEKIKQLLGGSIDYLLEQKVDIEKQPDCNRA